MARFADQVAIITGGAEGFGRGIANRLGAEGARIVIVDRNGPLAEESLNELAGKGIEAELVVGDVGDPDAAKQATERAVQTWGRIDILVNNAGIGGGYGNIWELSAEVMDEVYRTNLRGVFLFCHEVIPRMMERDYGRIVNVSSVAGKEGNPKTTPYSATKAAVIGLTKSVGKELALTGIRVNCITPAVAMTRPVQNADPEIVQYMLQRIPMGRPAEVDDIVNMVAFLSSSECSFSTGAVFDVSGGRATY
jgi:3-oxoacyl-[acyl-carrier protein] reductase